jgi:hypothetical protein
MRSFQIAAVGLGTLALLACSAILGIQGVDGDLSPPSDAAVNKENNAPDVLGTDGAESAASCTPGIAAMWRGENTATDLLGMNDFRWTTPPGTYSLGKVGNAFDIRMNGGDPVVYLNNTAPRELGTLAEGTISMWVNARSRGSLFCVTRAPLMAPGWCVSLAYDTPTSHVLELVVHDGSRTEVRKHEGAPRPINEWVHYAITFRTRGSDLDVELYTGGVSGSPRNIPNMKMPTPPTPVVSLGAVVPISNAGQFLGLIDEVVLFRRVLSRTEIEGLAATPDLSSLQPCP